MTNLDQKLLFAASTRRFFMCRVTVISGMHVYLIMHPGNRQQGNLGVLTANRSQGTIKEYLLYQPSLIKHSWSIVVVLSQLSEQVTTSLAMHRKVPETQLLVPLLDTSKKKAGILCVVWAQARPHFLGNTPGRIRYFLLASFLHRCCPTALPKFLNEQCTDIMRKVLEAFRRKRSKRAARTSECVSKSQREQDILQGENGKARLRQQIERLSAATRQFERHVQRCVHG